MADGGWAPETHAISNAVGWLACVALAGLCMAQARTGRWLHRVADVRRVINAAATLDASSASLFALRTWLDGPHGAWMASAALASAVTAQVLAAMAIAAATRPGSGRMGH